MPREPLDHPTPVAPEPAAPPRSGRVNVTLLLFALGVPLPLVLIVALLRGCQ